MSKHPKAEFFPMCDLHHSPMRRVMLEGPEAEAMECFHQCERRDCSRIYRSGHGYADFEGGIFDQSRASSRNCPVCGATLYLAEVNRTLKVETWECTEVGCTFSEDDPSPSSR